MYSARGYHHSKKFLKGEGRSWMAAAVVLNAALAISVVGVSETALRRASAASPQPRVAGDRMSMVNASRRGGERDLEREPVPMAVRLDSRVLSVTWRPLKTPLDRNPREYGGGMRIFPDAIGPGMTAKEERKVRVEVQVVPAQPHVLVFFRSFDVDDSSGLFATGVGGDNLASWVRPNDMVLSRGAFCGYGNEQPVAVRTDKRGIARATFYVTLQPGDNFKIVASVSEEVIKRLVVTKQRLLDPRFDQVIPERKSKRRRGDVAVATQLLTVWRRLHVEVDSMDEPVEPHTPGASKDPERSFLKGVITKIFGSRTKATRLVLKPEVTDSPVGLDDGSPNLSEMGRNRGNGRFENGKITIGDGNEAVHIEHLDGNGADFVEKKKGFLIPWHLVDVDGGRPVPAKPNRHHAVVRLDSSKREITLSRKLHGGVDYSGGKLTLAGVSFTVRRAQRNKIVVATEPNLPFLLVGDDEIPFPFLEKPPAGYEAQARTPFAFMQTSDDRRKNLYAPAYIRPVYDLPTSKVRFNLNVDWTFVQLKLNQGRDYVSTPDFWVLYLLGANKGTPFKRVGHGSKVRELGDADPVSEVISRGGVKRLPVLGQTSGALQPDGTLFRIGGSIVYVGTIKAVDRLTGFPCLEVTAVHESGHQWGLLDGTDGIMEPCSPRMRKEFTRDHQKLIRQRIHPLGG